MGDHAGAAAAAPAQAMEQHTQQGGAGGGSDHSTGNGAADAPSTSGEQEAPPSAPTGTRRSRRDSLASGASITERSERTSERPSVPSPEPTPRDGLQPRPVTASGGHQWGNGPLLGSQEELVMVYMLSLPMGTRNTAIKPNRRGFVGMIAVPTRDAEGVGAMPTVAEVRKLIREALLAGTDDFLFIKPKTAMSKKDRLALDEPHVGPITYDREEEEFSPLQRVSNREHKRGSNGQALLACELFSFRAKHDPKHESFFCKDCCAPQNNFVPGQHLHWHTVLSSESGRGICVHKSTCEAEATGDLGRCRRLRHKHVTPEAAEAAHFKLSQHKEAIMAKLYIERESASEAAFRRFCKSFTAAGDRGEALDERLTRKQTTGLKGKTLKLRIQ